MNASPRPPSRRRRLLRRAALAAAITTAGVAAWLWSLGGVVDDHVHARRGEIASVERGPLETLGDGVVAQAMRVTSTSGLAFDLRLLRPDPPPPPGPLVVILGGHRTGRDAVELVGDPQGVVVAALDYPYDGPERPRGLAQSWAALTRVRPALFDTPAAVSLAIDALLKEPGVDPARVELVGASLGVPFAATSAALDERVSRLWLVHGGGDNRRWLEHALERKIDAGWVRRPLAGLLHHVGRLGSLDAALRLEALDHRGLVVISSRDDARVPQASLDALLGAAPGHAVLLWTDGPHVSPKRPDLVRELVAMVLERL